MKKPFRFLLGCCLVSLVSVPSSLEAAISISFCSNNPGCICISWDYGGGTAIEVRCPGGGGDGWTNDPTGGGTNGPSDSWGGNSSLPAPEVPVPGTPLSGTLAGKVSQAVDLARQKLSPNLVFDNGKLVQEPTECTKLFDGNRTGYDGKWLLNQYVVFRDGQGVTGPGGTQPCNQGYVAWTTCCTHRRYVFICSGFQNLSVNNGTANIIHELMHVAGQTEDTNSTTGPGNPPNSGEITAVVKQACSL